MEEESDSFNKILKERGNLLPHIYLNINGNPVIEILSNNEREIVNTKKYLSQMGLNIDDIIRFDDIFGKKKKKKDKKPKIDDYYCRRPNPNKEAGGCPLKKFSYPCRDICPEEKDMPMATFRVFGDYDNQFIIDINRKIIEYEWNKKGNNVLDNTCCKNCKKDCDCC